MSDYQPTNDMPVDRREETVVAQRPGYATTEQVTRDLVTDAFQKLSSPPGWPSEIPSVGLPV